ncbi:MAG: cytochrome b/b6 domain-containing protein [Methanobacteriaceae archaeon]|nr:cytochrome b/b6 domain-containing protein [Methanobacteriaceae archaeon]
MNKERLIEKMKDVMIKTRSFYENLSPRQSKAVNILATAPLIAASIDGACAGGCPYGLSYDPYPGRSGRYMDSNGTGACDLASADVATQQTTSSSDTRSQDSSSQSSSSSDENGNSGGVSSDDTSTDNASNASTVPDSTSTGIDDSSTADGTNFHILPATLIILGAYLLTYYLFKKGILKARVHKRIWNGLLTFGFLGMGITGVILTVMINMGISTVYNSGMTYWHAELALLMVLAAFIHFHIYRRPFKRMFKVLFDSNSSKKDKNVIKTPGTSK